MQHAHVQRQNISIVLHIKLCGHKYWEKRNKSYSEALYTTIYCVLMNFTYILCLGRNPIFLSPTTKIQSNYT